MYSIVRSATLRGLRADAKVASAEAQQLREELAATKAGVKMLDDFMTRAENTVRRLLQELAEAYGDRIRSERECAQRDAAQRAELKAVLEALRGQADREQSRRLDHIYVLLHRGGLHSAHATRDSAEGTAESEGAPRGGWTLHVSGCAPFPSAEVAWQIQSLPLVPTA